MSVSIQKSILYRIRGKGRGWVFSPKHFLDIGSRDSVDKALSRLVNQGAIRRLGRGIYDYPKISPKIGALTPSSDQIADVVAQKHNNQLQITGAQAANLLGLSTQVPAKITYLTDGRSRKILVGRQTFNLHHASPKKIALTGNSSGLVIQALNYIGKRKITADIINKLKKKLSQKDKKNLQRDIDKAPDWMRPIITQITAH